MKRQGTDTQFNVAYDLEVIKAMAAEMEEYLKSEILFWQLSPAARISPPPPMLTVGGYLLRAHRLQGQRPSLAPKQQAQRQVAEDAFRSAIEQWPAHTQKRVEQELKARLNSWQWFVDDCQANKKGSIAYYATEAELRTLIELLLELGAQLGDMQAHKVRLQALDKQFQSWFKVGDFVWRSELQFAYPKERFWWLYGRPEFPSGR